VPSEPTALQQGEDGPAKEARRTLEGNKVSKMRYFILASLPLLATAGVFFGPCTRENIQIRQNADAYGNLPPGGTYKDCDQLGEYQPKQCSGSQCYCVDKSGAKIESYSVNRGEAQQMNCNCAREESEIVGLGKLLRCDPFGDYHHTQQRGDQCYCADRVTGESTGTEATVGLCRQLEELCAASSQPRSAVLRR